MVDVCDEFKILQDRLAALSSEGNPNTSNQQVPGTIPDPQSFFEVYNQNEEPFENFTDRLEAFFAVRDVSPELQAGSLILSLKSDLHATLKNSLFPRRCADLSYEELKCKLNDIVNPKKGILPSRCKLLNRKQRKGESFDDYITELRKLIVDCQYPDSIVADMLRDVFIAGVWSYSIRNKLLEKDDISFDTVLHIATSLEELGSGDAQGDSQQKARRNNNDSKKSHNRNDRSKKWSKNSADTRRSAFSTKTSSSLGCKPSTSTSSDSSEPPFIANSEPRRVQFGMKMVSLTSDDGKCGSVGSQSDADELAFAGKRSDKFAVSFPGASVQIPCVVILEWSGSKDITEHAVLKVSSTMDRTEGSVLVSTYIGVLKT